MVSAHDTARWRNDSPPLRLSDSAGPATCPPEFRIESQGRHAVTLTCPLDERAEQITRGSPVVVWLELPRADRGDPVPLRLDDAEDILLEALETVREAKRRGIGRPMREKGSA